MAISGSRVLRGIFRRDIAKVSEEENLDWKLTEIDNKIRNLTLEAEHLEKARMGVEKNMELLDDNAKKIEAMQSKLSLSEYKKSDGAIDWARYKEKEGQLNSLLNLNSVAANRIKTHLGDFKKIEEITARLEEINREIMELAKEGEPLLEEYLTKIGVSNSYYRSINKALGRRG